MRARRGRARSAPAASRWKSGCIISRCCRRSTLISRAAVSLSRSALGGQGVVMVHYNRVQGLTDYVTEAKAVAKAARDVGVRVGFAVALRDRNPLVYGPSEPILDALAARRGGRNPQAVPARDAAGRRTDRARGRCGCCGLRSPDFNVQYGPAARAMVLATRLLRAVAEASARTGRRVHMHCLETRYQRDWADREFRRRHDPLSRRDRAAVAAADACALHLRAAGRTRTAGRTRRDDFGQYLVQSRHPFRYRAACRK